MTKNIYGMKPNICDYYKDYKYHKRMFSEEVAYEMQQQLVQAPCWDCDGLDFLCEHHPDSEPHVLDEDIFIHKEKWYDHY